MKELTPEEMKLISGGAMRRTEFGPAGFVVQLILGALFFDFGGDRPPPVKAN